MAEHTISLSEIALELGDRIQHVEEPDLDTLYPSQGRVCKTTDTQTVFWGTGSQWISVPDSGELGSQSINASEAIITALQSTTAQINTDLDDADAPVDIEASGGRAVALYPRGGTTDRANFTWIDPADGTKYCAVSGRDNRFGVYTDNGGGSTSKRLHVPGGTTSVAPRWENVNSLSIRGTNSSHQINLQTGSTGDAIVDPIPISGGVSQYRFRDDAGSNQFVLYNHNLDKLRLYNYSASGSTFEVDLATNAVNWQQNESQNVVWESDTTANRPASPVVGQRFFDTDLGQPIWFNGTDWVDAQGTVV